MNVYNSCDSTYIFHAMKNKCFIELGFASLNRTFHRSSHESICTIALMTIHYLYKIYGHINLTVRMNHVVRSYERQIEVALTRQ